MCAPIGAGHASSSRREAPIGGGCAPSADQNAALAALGTNIRVRGTSNQSGSTTNISGSTVLPATLNHSATNGLDGGIGAQLDININGIDWNTGSLGHSIGVSTGLAIGQESGNYTITVIGDAECYEGSVWESIVLAGEKNIENLIVIVDRNRLSVTEELGDDSFFKCYKDSLTSLGWHFNEIDGHNFDQIISSLKECKSINKPSLIIANTIKGKGVSFMENKKDWHHSVPNEKEVKLAVDSL